MVDPARGSSGRAVPGHRLGPFAILDVLGEGGSGVVYRARWGHREVALKVLRDEGVGARERERFFDEAARLAELAHPGVIKVFGSGELPDGRPYLAMELFEGETLAARLSRGPVPLPRALALFSELCDAAHAMHRSGLVHRDLKPENVLLVGGEAHAVLLDFGIAKGLDAPASTVTQEGGVRGTPAYMAPERFFGAPAGVATDVYELAVVLFAMLSGALPWDEVGDPAGRLAPRRLSERGASVPPAIDEALARALSTRPEVRPASAAELAAVVNAGRGGEAPRQTVDLRGGRAPAASEPGPATKTARRRWPLWVGAAAVALAAVAGGVALLSRGEPGVAASAPIDAAVAETEAEPDDVPAFVPRDGDDSGLATAARILPGATDFYVALRARELRQSEAFVDLFTELRASSELAPVRALAELCGVDPIDDLDWIAMTGVAAKKSEVEVDVVAAGAWNRAEIETCLGQMGEVVADGRFTELRADGKTHWIAWLDERTALFSSRARADRAWLEARLAGKDGLEGSSGPVAALLRELDRDATLVIASRADEALGELWTGLPAPPLSGAELRVGAELDGRLVLRFGDAAAAASAETAARAGIDRFHADPIARIYAGEIDVATEGADVIIAAHLDEAMTTLTASALSSVLAAR